MLGVNTRIKYADHNAFSSGVVVPSKVLRGPETSSPDSSRRMLVGPGSTEPFKVLGGAVLVESTPDACAGLAGVKTLGVLQPQIGVSRDITGVGSRVGVVGQCRGENMGLIQSAESFVEVTENPRGTDGIGCMGLKWISGVEADGLHAGVLEELVAKAVVHPSEESAVSDLIDVVFLENIFLADDFNNLPIRGGSDGWLDENDHLGGAQSWRARTRSAR